MKSFKQHLTEAKRYTMFIDDERNPVKKFDYIVRDYKETMKIFDRHGCPTFISFDHDLGDKSKTGFDISKNISEMLDPDTSRLKILRNKIAPMVSEFYPEFTNRIWDI